MSGLLFVAALLGTPLLVRVGLHGGWTLGPAMLVGYGWMAGVLAGAHRRGWPPAGSGWKGSGATGKAPGSAAGGGRSPSGELRVVFRGVALGGLLFVLGGLGYALTAALGWETGPPAPRSEPGIPGSALLVVAFGVAAVLEERAFRGRLLTWLEGEVGGAAAVGLQAVAFSLWHLRPGQLVSALLYGGVLGWAARREGDLRVPMVAHVVLNLAGLGLWLAGVMP